MADDQARAVQNGGGGVLSLRPMRALACAISEQNALGITFVHMGAASDETGAQVPILKRLLAESDGGDAADGLR